MSASKATALQIIFILLLTSAFSIQKLYSQDVSLNLYNSWNVNKMYNADTIEHTIWKPVLYTDTLYKQKDYSWLRRKFFQEHLISVQNPGFNLYGDIAIDEYIGKSKRFVKTPMMNTRGYEVYGNAGSKIYFQTTLYENQGRFGGYIDSFIRQYKVVPGQASYKNIGDGKGFDFTYSTARIIYVPNKHLLFDLGYNNNFIGDGNRSLILSDFATNYPYLRTAVTFGKFQYSFMWARYTSDRRDSIYSLGYPRKWSQTFVIDWKATKNFTVSLIESVMWPNRDTGVSGKFNANILSPVIFLHGSTAPGGYANNELLGVNLKYKIIKNTYLYAQFVADNLGKEKWNKTYGIQAGIRGGDIFDVKDLNASLEFNTVRPYTYAASATDQAFTHFSMPLAHPLGANFKEFYFAGDYLYKHFYFAVNAFYSSYGADSIHANFGSNPTKSTDYRTPTANVKTGQGIDAKIYFAQVRLAYIINEKSNLRIETGFTYRKNKSDIFNYKDNIFYIGVRTTFRKPFYEF